MWTSRAHKCRNRQGVPTYRTDNLFGLTDGERGEGEGYALASGTYMINGEIVQVGYYCTEDLPQGSSARANRERQHRIQDSFWEANNRREEAVKTSNGLQLRKAVRLIQEYLDGSDKETGSNPVAGGSEPHKGKFGQAEGENGPEGGSGSEAGIGDLLKKFLNNRKMLGNLVGKSANWFAENVPEGLGQALIYEAAAIGLTVGAFYGGRSAAMTGANPGSIYALGQCFGGVEVAIGAQKRANKNWDIFIRSQGGGFQMHRQGRDY